MKMANVLIVDDERKIREGLREYAEFDGHTVTEAENGMEAVSICKEHDFDIIIMDVMMPKLDGFSACKEIRKSKDIPVLMLSARGEEYDKLFGFEVGIDDYVVKPFSPKEVMARVNVIIDRHIRQKNETNQKQKICIDGIEIDVTGRNVLIDGYKADITPKEMDLLIYLAKNQNIALSREKILCEVWGYDFYGGDRTVDTHIKMLRNSLGIYKDHIITLRGIGYELETP